MSTFRIGFVGECMIELHETQECIKKGFGGDTVNTAIYLSRLQQLAGEGLPRVSATYLSAMGTDSQSSHMLSCIAKEGVDTNGISRIDGKLPGLYLIENDASGERRFHYWRNDAAARFWTQGFDDAALFELLASFDMIYLSGISLAIQFAGERERLLSALQRYQANGGNVVFDSNYRPRLWENEAQARDAYAMALSVSSLALLTFDDEALLFGDKHPIETVERVNALGCTQVVVKCGAEDCLVANKQNVERVPATKVDCVVDTTSAGDAFNAGYLLGMVAGASNVQCAAMGHLLASHVIQAKGAVIPHECMPTAQQIQSLLFTS